jgi:Icc-related predicted phosphoesterase
MKIALFSDIHANLPALEAFFAQVEQQKPDAIYCLGDLVCYNIWPNEVPKREIPRAAMSSCISTSTAVLRTKTASRLNSSGLTMI